MSFINNLDKNRKLNEKNEKHPIQTKKYNTYLHSLFGHDDDY